MAYVQYGRNVLRLLIQGQRLKSSDDAVHPLFHDCQTLRFRKLEVILTTSIEKLGKAGDTVKVAPGYFRNHLMPKLLAVPNIDKFAYLIQEQRKIYQPVEVEEVRLVKETKEDKMREYEVAAKRLDNSRVVLRRFINKEKFNARATKDEAIELLVPVTEEELVGEVASQLSVQVDPQNLHLPSPILKFGEFEVTLRLPKSIPLPEGKVQWTLKVKVKGKYMVPFCLDVILLRRHS